ncbi:hypothetical protein CWS31_008880 [Colwellia echini]|uniref:Outer membrane protein beta-barrel domain-containing protein n=1 Tax=Colwellia echini TaxID=1982103 RepID=A0ABY3MXF2_9GAMM|nr:hypothetical protein CWS31_008880 [Colwellia echini]
MALLSSFATAETEQQKIKAEDEKNNNDPTKVITRVGLGYSDDLTISGSLAFGPVSKLNAKTNSDFSEWRFGGSWLFDFGIVNVSFNRAEYDEGGSKNTYSIGTYLPLNVLGVDTGKWMVFPMAGYSHTDGETLTPTDSEVANDSSIASDGIMTQNTSNGGYIGAFLLRPITKEWTVLAFGGGGMGSNDYSNVWGGGGVSYKLNENNSFNFYGYISDDDYGKINKLGVSYTYEFQ